MDSQLFESISLDTDVARMKSRRALAVANKRAKDRFGEFVKNASPQDRVARLALIEDDLQQIVSDVVAEYGGEVIKVANSIRRSFEEYNDADEDHGGKCQQHGKENCPLCRGETSKEAGNADHLKEYQFKPKGDGDGDEDDEETESTPEDEVIEEELEKDASLKEARRPKMCPYHSEVVDISLGSGDPQAGFNAMNTHSWGPNHCKGGYDGNCNFRPQMVTQKYWDDKQQEYAERRQERELAEQNQIGDPVIPSIQTEPVMTEQPLEHGEGEGVTDIDAQLADAPSAIGQMAFAHVAADAPSGAGGAVTREKLPKADESGLGGPSPKIDKSKSGDEWSWNTDSIDTQMDNSPHPTEEQDITVKGDMRKDDFLAQTDAVTTQEDLPSDKENAGFSDGGENKGPNTDTWNGTEGLAKPVTQTALSAKQDPDKNPLREIIDNDYDGFVPVSQVDLAIRAFEG